MALIRVGSRGSRLALTQAELAGERHPRRRGVACRDRARPDHDRRRQGPDEAVRRDRLARRVRQGARGGAARGSDRRRGALGEGHDLDGRGRAGGRRVPAARGSRATRSAAPTRCVRGCASAPRRFAGARSCSRSSPGCRSSRCAGTSTRGCASAWSAGSTRSCSPRAGSTGSASPPRRGIASIPRSCCRRPARVRSRFRCAPGEEQLVAAIDDAETRRRVEAERACVAAVGGGCPAPVAAHHDGERLRRSWPLRTARGSSG